MNTQGWNRFFDSGYSCKNCSLKYVAKKYKNWYLYLWKESLPWSYGCWIYNYLCNQCLWPLKLWVRIPFMSKCTRYNIMWSSLLPNWRLDYSCLYLHFFFLKHYSTDQDIIPTLLSLICEFESHSCRSVLDTTVCDQVCQ
jgi:hypothetical protein